jgi:hypothetical protein
LIDKGIYPVIYIALRFLTGFAGGPDAQVNDGSISGNSYFAVAIGGNQSSITFIMGLAGQRQEQ